MAAMAYSVGIFSILKSNRINRPNKDAKPMAPTSNAIKTNIRIRLSFGRYLSSMFILPIVLFVFFIPPCKSSNPAPNKSQKALSDCAETKESPPQQIFYEDSILQSGPRTVPTPHELSKPSGSLPGKSL